MEVNLFLCQKAVWNKKRGKPETYFWKVMCHFWRVVLIHISYMCYGI